MPEDGGGRVDLANEAEGVVAVIASFDRTFNYYKLQVAFDADSRRSAFLYATNADRYCPVPGGSQPDAAAVIAAIEASTGMTVEAVVGKPSRYMAEAILDVLGLPPDHCLMIGDRLETDVLMGLNAGMAGALTLTGATDESMLARSEISGRHRTSFDPFRGVSTVNFPVGDDWRCINQESGCFLMTRPFLLGIDQGTSGSRALVIDREGALRGYADRPSTGSTHCPIGWNKSRGRGARRGRGHCRGAE